MLRANRIGTPYIFNYTYSDQTGTITIPTLGTFSERRHVAMAIDANVFREFGKTSVHWANATPGTLNSKTQFVMGMQFTIVEPIDGNVPSLELMGSIRMSSDKQLDIIPCVGQLNAPIGTTLGSQFMDYMPIFMDAENNGYDPSASQSRFLAFRQQIIFEEPDYTKTFLGGFNIANSQAAASITSFECTISIRQLTDQQGIGYPDGRR